jgi:hypothetical protein
MPESDTRMLQEPDPPSRKLISAVACRLHNSSEGMRSGQPDDDQIVAPMMAEAPTADV